MGSTRRLQTPGKNSHLSTPESPGIIVIDLTVAIISLMLITTMRSKGFPDHACQHHCNSHMAVHSPVLPLIPYLSLSPEMRSFSWDFFLNSWVTASIIPFTFSLFPDTFCLTFLLSLKLGLSLNTLPLWLLRSMLDALFSILYHIGSTGFQFALLCCCCCFFFFFFSCFWTCWWMVFHPLRWEGEGMHGWGESSLLATLIWDSYYMEMSRWQCLEWQAELRVWVWESGTGDWKPWDGWGCPGRESR